MRIDRANLLTTVAICGVLGMSPVVAQDYDADPTDIFAGCDSGARAPSEAGSPRERMEQQAKPKVDRITQRSFASFSLDDIDNGVPGEMSSLCWARLDGVWRETGQVLLDRSQEVSDIWGSDTPELMALANGSYTSLRHVVIEERSDPAQSLWLSTGLTGLAFVEFASTDGVALEDVLQRGGARKTYTATSWFEFGSEIHVDVTRSGRVRLSMANQTFIRPQPGVSKATMSSQLAADDAFLLSYNLDNLAASRRGYDPIRQDAFKLLDNPMLEVFAKVDPKSYYITEKRTVPMGFSLVQEGLQGMVYRKSLVTNEEEMQQTLGGSIGVKAGAADESLNPFKNKVGFEIARSTTNSMKTSGSIAQSVGYSRQKQYALIVDHPYITLSDDFIDAVEDARRYHKYQALIDKFGTHYPYAVTFGAAAKITQSFTNESYTSYAEQNTEFKSEAGSHTMGYGGEIQAGIKAGSVSGTSGSIGRDDVSFVAVGGNGSWDQNGYAAGTTPYPILLDLRPLDELLNPMNFPGEPEVYDRVRRNLQRAILLHADRSAGSLDTTSNLPTVIAAKPEPIETWSIYIRRIACTKAFGDFTKQASGTLFVEGYSTNPESPNVQAGEQNMRAPCHMDRKNQTLSYRGGDPGLLVIRGTRAQIAEYSVKLQMDVGFHDMPHIREFRKPEPLYKGMAVGKTKDYGWKLEQAFKPNVYLVVRFKRSK